MEVALLLALAFAINKTVTVVKSLANKDWNTPVTQLVVWVVGFAGLTLAAHADVTQALTIPGVDTALGTLDSASLVLLAWILGATGSFGYDTLKAVDNTTSSAEPQLLGPKPPAA